MSRKAKAFAQAHRLAELGLDGLGFPTTEDELEAHVRRLQRRLFLRETGLLDETLVAALTGDERLMRFQAEAESRLEQLQERQRVNFHYTFGDNATWSVTPSRGRPHVVVEGDLAAVLEQIAQHGLTEARFPLGAWREFGGGARAAAAAVVRALEANGPGWAIVPGFRAGLAPDKAALEPFQGLGGGVILPIPQHVWPVPAARQGVSEAQRWVSPRVLVAFVTDLPAPQAALDTQAWLTDTGRPLLWLSTYRPKPRRKPGPKGPQSKATRLARATRAASIRRWLSSSS